MFCIMIISLLGVKVANNNLYCRKLIASTKELLCLLSVCYGLILFQELAGREFIGADFPSQESIDLPPRSSNYKPRGSVSISQACPTRPSGKDAVVAGKYMNKLIETWFRGETK